jgi:spermidine synthase
MGTDVLDSMLVFPKDMLVSNAPVNKLNNQILVRFFEEEWSEYVH